MSHVDFTRTALQAKLDCQSFMSLQVQALE